MPSGSGRATASDRAHARSEVGKGRKRLSGCGAEDDRELALSDGLRVVPAMSGIARPAAMRIVRGTSGTPSTPVEDIVIEAVARKCFALERFSSNKRSHRLDHQARNRRSWLDLAAT